MSTDDLRHTPAHLSSYYFIIQHLTEGKPTGNKTTGFPYQIMEGQDYDFLSIETGDDAAKPAVEKPKEAPLKEKSR